MKKLNYPVTFAPDREEPLHCDAYRLAYSEKNIFLDFGVLQRQEKSRQIEAVNILTRVALPVEVLEQLLMALFLTGQKYEKEYQRDIGMSFAEESAGEKEGEV